MIQTVIVNFATGELTGNIIQSTTLLSSMEGLYENEAARKAMPSDTPMYKVQVHEPDASAEGGLLFGTSFINPGLVGEEYFMTKGHYHNKRDTAEYYWCISGQGMLLLMDENSETTWQEMKPGVLCYIPRRVAHRLVNTGDNILTIGACWPSDAGHDYGSIREKGFGVRVKKINGEPKVIKNHD